MGQRVLHEQAKEAAVHFESGHVCRSCESQILMLPDGGYFWCPTCGFDTHGPVSDICSCGAMLGKHSAGLQCVSSANWQNESNPLLRRKVVVAQKPPATHKPIKLRDTKPVLFDDDVDARYE